jgi:peptidoglycan biosynthesis protein MviN/MurJ (putative lipid II flippase)
MNQEQHSSEHSKQYKKFIVMAVLSFICMYILMYSMVNTFSNVFNNVNQFYMAGLMTMPIVIIEIALKSSMYKNEKLNALIIVISTIALIGFFCFIRQQTAVSDEQFLKSMIPHHGAAILMCEKSNIHDPEIIKLCQQIRSSQQREIDQMKAKLKQLEK